MLFFCTPWPHLSVCHQSRERLFSTIWYLIYCHQSRITVEIDMALPNDIVICSWAGLYHIQGRQAWQYRTFHAPTGPLWHKSCWQAAKNRLAVYMLNTMTPPLWQYMNTDWILFHPLWWYGVYDNTVWMAKWMGVIDWMNEWMNECMDGWMNEWMHACMHACMHG